MANQLQHRCPCCGSPVRIHSADEGTQSYEPLIDARLVEALERIREQAAALGRLLDDVEFRYRRRKLRAALVEYARLKKEMEQ